MLTDNVQKESMDKKQKISVVINTYNAERHLKRVLQSVKGFDEIVVCDMESTDSTLDIARERGCKVVTFQKKNYTIVEPARQFAIDSATNEWVLVVDADELVTDELREELYNSISKADCAAGILIPRRNYFMGRLYDYPDYQLRFLKKEGCHWPPTIHSRPTVNGPTRRLPAKRKELAFIHLADDTISLRLKKLNTYTDNEVKKRIGKRYTTFDLIMKPLWRTLRRYFFKGGIGNGAAGMINAVLDGLYKFITIAKIMEEEERKNDIR